MLEVLSTIFGSIFSGGATGLIGVAIQRYADYKNKQADLELQAKKFEYDIALKKADAEIMAQEWAAKTQVAKIETEGASDVAASQAFAASYAADAQRQFSTNVVPGRVGGFLLILLDVLRGAVRPLLTIYLCALTTYIWLQAHDVLGRIPLDAKSALDVWHLIVSTILYLTTTCVLWWFGTRNRQSAPRIK